MSISKRPCNTVSPSDLRRLHEAFLPAFRVNARDVERYAIVSRTYIRRVLALFGVELKIDFSGTELVRSHIFEVLSDFERDCPEFIDVLFSSEFFCQLMEGDSTFASNPSPSPSAMGQAFESEIFPTPPSDRVRLLRYREGFLPRGYAVAFGYNKKGELTLWIERLMGEYSFILEGEEGKAYVLSGNLPRSVQSFLNLFDLSEIEKKLLLSNDQL